MAAGSKRSRESAEAAGWSADGYPRPNDDAPPWRDRLDERENPKWDSFSWLTVRALFGSINDLFATFRPEIVDERRARWVAAQRGRMPADRADLVISPGDDGRAEKIERAFFLVGDTGEQDASQYAVAPYLTTPATNTDPHGAERAAEFLQIVSDVIYPAGDINEYVNGFYIPYRDFEKPIYAQPGNHDWYDGLDGFMYHFCGAEPLPPERFRSTEIRPATRLANMFWRRGAAPERQRLSHRRGERPWGRDATGAMQPAPYFALDLGDLLLVSIDTGVTGAIDDEQGRWLLRVSERPQQKILLTGKPIYVDGAYHPGEIAWKPSKLESEDEEWPHFATVDDVVREESFGYLAAIGGDVHNYQRYPIRLEKQERTIYYLVSGGGGAYLSPTHRIGPTEDEPRSKHRWPEDLKMPRDEDVPQVVRDEDSDSGTTEEAEEDDVATTFHCYPQRGDSLAYTARRAGPRMFNVVQAAAAAFAAAAGTLLYVAPPDQAEALALGTAYLPLAIVAMIVFLATKLGIIARFGSVPPPQPWQPDGVRYKLVAKIFATLVFFALTALGAEAIAAGQILSDAQFWATAVIALAVPVLGLLGILLAHDLRGSVPASLPQLAVVGVFAAAVPILCPFGELFGAPPWFATALFVLAVTAVGMQAFGTLRAKTRVKGSGAGVWRISGNVLDSLLTVAAPALLAFALWEELDAGTVPWLALALVFCGAWPALVALSAKTRDPSRLATAERRLGWIGTASRFLAAIAWVTSAAILLQTVGDGWIVTAAVGSVAILALALTFGAMCMLAFGTVMKRFYLAIAIALVLLLPLFLPLSTRDTAILFLAAAAFLLLVAILNVGALSGGRRLNANAAQTKIRSILNEGFDGELPDGPRHMATMDEKDEALFKLLYPYRWAKRSRDEGAQSSGAPAQTVAKLLAELGDADEAPFFKNLLRVDIDDRQRAEGDEEHSPNRELTIRCFGVTGFADGQAEPAVEDEITIAFRSAEAFEELFPQSTEPSQ